MTPIDSRTFSLGYNRTIQYLSMRVILMEVRMPITASSLRQNIYKLLDKVIETGEPLEISRKGALLQIIPIQKQKKIHKLKMRDVIKGDPESLLFT